MHMAIHDSFSLRHDHNLRVRPTSRRTLAHTPYALRLTARLSVLIKNICSVKQGGPLLVATAAQIAAHRANAHGFSARQLARAWLPSQCCNQFRSGQPDRAQGVTMAVIDDGRDSGATSLPRVSLDESAGVQIKCRHA
jgi:hypothetical protein